MKTVAKMGNGRRSDVVRRWPARALALGLLAISAGAHAMPSTFGPVIGNAVLCRSHLDSGYFYSYLSSAFGPSYKHEGGAFWFKAEGTLWGTTISDIIVSDDSGPITFVGAVAEATPDKLDEAIRSSVGTRHYKIDTSSFPVLESSPGSKIVYFNAKSKIYCAKFKPTAPGR